MLNIFLFGTLLGVLSHDYLHNYTLTGIKGIEYYSDKHTTFLNINIHILCMPYIVYSFLYLISSLLFLNKYSSEKLSYLLYSIYGGHYIKINIINTIPYYILYYFVLYCFNYNYSNDLTMLSNLKKQNKINLPVNFYIFKKGFIYFSFFVLFQEVVGHILGNENPYNEENILNSFLYSMYFSSIKLCSIYEFLYV